MNKTTLQIIMFLILFLTACTPAPPQATPTSLPSATVSPSGTSTPVPPSTTPSTTVVQTPQYINPVYVNTPLPDTEDTITLTNIDELAMLGKYNLLNNTSFNFLSFSPDSTHMYTLNQDFDLTTNQFVTISALPDDMPGTFELTVVSSDEFIPHKNIPENLKEAVNHPFDGFSFHIKDDIDKTYFFPDNEHLLICLTNGKIWFVNVISQISQLIEGTYQLSPDLVINTGEGIVRNIYISPDHSRMIIIKQNHILQIWNTATLTKLQTFYDLEWPVRVAVSPNNQLLAISTADQMIRIYDLENNEQLNEYSGHDNPILGMVFSPNGKYLASIDSTKVVLWGIPENDKEKPLQEDKDQQFISTIVLPTATITPTSSIADYRNEYPLSWPIALPSSQQNEEVRNCDIEEMALIRYPESLEYNELESSYKPITACDWAILSIAYVNHDNHFSFPSEEGKRAFAQTIRMNPGFAFAKPVFEHYFDQINLVETPEFAEKTIQHIEFTYQLHYDIGNAPIYRYDIRLSRVENKDLFKADVDLFINDTRESKTTYIDADLIHSINNCMTDFIPITDPGEQLEYTDSGLPYPIRITFEDGSEIEIENYFPDWCHYLGLRLIQIDNTYYVQYSDAIIESLNTLSPYLDLPYNYKFENACRYPILE